MIYNIFDEERIDIDCLGLLTYSLFKNEVNRV